MKIKKLVTKFTQAHWLFVIIALIFGAILISLTPPLWGADERAHFFRAYQISEGQLVQSKQNIDGNTSYGGYIPSSFNKLGDLVARDVGNNPSDNKQQVDNRSDYTVAGNVKIREDTLAPNPYRAIIYPTITYIAPALGMAVASVVDPTALSLMYAARIATLFAYVLLVFVSIFLLRNKSVKWVVFVVALLPMALYQASVVSADSLLLALSLILFSLTYRIIYRDIKIDKHFVLLLLVVSGLLTLIKPPYVILVLPLLFLSPSAQSVGLRRAVRVFIPIACIVIAALAIISVQRFEIAPLPYTSLTGQLHWIVSHPFGYLYMLINSIAMLDWIPQSIGLFGTSFIFMPGPIIELLLVLLTFIAFIKIKSINEKDKSVERVKTKGLLLLSVATLTSGAIVTTLYLSWTHIGAQLVEGIQGRYFLPVICFVLVGMRMLTGSRFVVTEKNARILIPSLIIFSLVSSMLWYYRILY